LEKRKIQPLSFLTTRINKFCKPYRQVGKYRLSKEQHKLTETIHDEAQTSIVLDMVLKHVNLRDSQKDQQKSKQNESEKLYKNIS
jgi:hypothetical protein